MNNHKSNGERPALPVERLEAARADLHAAANAQDVPAMLRGLADALDHLGALPAQLVPTAMQRRVFKFRLLSISSGDEEGSDSPTEETTHEESEQADEPRPGIDGGTAETDH